MFLLCVAIEGSDVSHTDDDGALAKEEKAEQIMELTTSCVRVVSILVDNIVHMLSC